MLALYRSRRQADALAAYTAGRSLLVGELALEPGPQLRQLQQAILEQDPAPELSWAMGRVGSALAVAAPAVQAASPADGAAADEPELEVMPRRGRRHRVGWMGLALVVGAALAVLAIVEGAGGSTGPHGKASGNALALISSVDGAVEATVPLSAPPTDVTAGFGSLWVTEASAGLLVRVDAQRRKVIATIPVGARPSRVITADGRVWVLDPVNGTVSAYDAGTGTVAQTSRVGKDPSDLVFSDGRV
jgi:Bacterial transcriptional activator domain